MTLVCDVLPLNTNCPRANMVHQHDSPPTHTEKTHAHTCDKRIRSCGRDLCDTASINEPGGIVCAETSSAACLESHCRSCAITPQQQSLPSLSFSLWTMITSPLMTTKKNTRCRQGLHTHTHGEASTLINALVHPTSGISVPAKLLVGNSFMA